MEITLAENGREFLIRIPLSAFPALAGELSKAGKRQIFDRWAARQQLTARQKEIFTGIVAGKCNKDIANALHITVRTVKFHVANLLKKFDVPSRRELSLLDKEKP